MTITVLLQVHAKPGRSEALIAFYRHILGDTRTHPGCLEVRVVQDLDDHTRFTLIERWQSRAQQEDYVGWRAAGQTMHGYGGLLLGAPVLAIYEDTDI